ncbi:polysaccharide deacetylase family protein [Ancylobacter mangrovi]|uniref:polysaccharide deacetylase family protein n=1 Tax=Ancylobacter mangrovi TaxID=2972472 RepID=UPI002162D8C3|nr:polysaccharide deacetylase family protein [Ancylobacter mangrovi]MCS0505232.1 polysaccharide deacetylase family protein [Ancylobacter mangrovi]
MLGHSWRLPTLALLAACLLPGSAFATDSCAGKLGTERVLEVDPHHLQVGTKHFPQTLDLAEGEVVLTFDDGPHPGATEAVLKALAQQCTRATFFVIGRNAAAHPALLKQILAGGHTLGYHSQTHPMTLADLPFDKAVADIEKGFATVDKAAYGKAGAQPRVPFFRFPGFGSSPQLLAYLDKRGVGVFGADLWAGDWNPMTADQQLKLLMSRLDRQRRGIILLHDTHQQTAKMMPAFLAELHRKGYHVVHVVPAGPVTATAPQ